jgi:hypothetical protein
MKHSPRDSKPAKLSESLTRLLESYTLAASAAGVCMVALAAPSEAKIVYTKTHRVIGWNRAHQLDLNHDGTIDFLILHFASSKGADGTVSTKEAFGNAILGSWFCGTGCGYSSVGFPYDAALNNGSQIGPGQEFITCPCQGELMAQYGDATWRGKWTNVRNRYLGLRFEIHGKNHYGWARLNIVLDQKRRLIATLTGYAYETIPNKGIRAGETVSDDVTEKPKTLATLALGAQGIRRNQ